MSGHKDIVVLSRGNTLVLRHDSPACNCGTFVYP